MCLSVAAAALCNVMYRIICMICRIWIDVSERYSENGHLSIHISVTHDNIHSIYPRSLDLIIHQPNWMFHISTLTMYHDVLWLYKRHNLRKLTAKYTPHQRQSEIFLNVLVLFERFIVLKFTTIIGQQIGPHIKTTRRNMYDLYTSTPIPNTNLCNITNSYHLGYSLVLTEHASPMNQAIFDHIRWNEAQKPNFMYRLDWLIAFLFEYFDLLLIVDCDWTETAMLSIDSIILIRCACVCSYLDALI